MSQINSFNGGAALAGDMVKRDDLKPLHAKHNNSSEDYNPLEEKTLRFKNLIIRQGDSDVRYDPLGAADTTVEIASNGVKFFNYSGSPYIDNESFTDIMDCLTNDTPVIWRYASGSSVTFYQAISVDATGLQFAKVDSEKIKIFSVSSSADQMGRHLVTSAEYPYSGGGSSFVTLAKINHTDAYIKQGEYDKIDTAYSSDNFVALEVSNDSCNPYIYVFGKRVNVTTSESTISTGYIFTRVASTGIESILIGDDLAIYKTSTPFTASVTAESVNDVIQSSDSSVTIEISNNKVDLKVSHPNSSALSFCHTMPPATSSPNISLNMDGSNYTINGTLVFLSDWLTLTKNVSNIKIVVNQQGVNPNDSVACGLALYEWMENEKDPQNPSNLQYMKLKKIASTPAFAPTVGVHQLNFTSIQDANGTEVITRQMDPNRYYYICLLYKPESANGMTVRGFNTGTEAVQQAPFVNFRTNNVYLEQSPPANIETWNYDASSVYSVIRARQYAND